MSKIIAFTGAKGSGKDTAASFLSHQYGVVPLAFADPIKKELMWIFNINSISDYDVFKRSKIKMPYGEVDGRRVVREIGMLMRRYDEDQFINYVDESVERWDRLFAITDLRFDNEMLYCKHKGAKIVKIIRPGTESDSHITEKGFDDSNMDLIIYNDYASVREFESNLQKIFDKKLKEWSWI